MIRSWRRLAIIDAHPEPEQLCDCSKDQGEELSEMNLVGEEKEAQASFASAKLSIDLISVS